MLLSKLSSKYTELIDNEEPKSSLSFAWENWDDEKQAIIPYTVEDVADTNVLVVIGYSFPFFNREIDRQIIGGMEKLEKVYFQDMKPDRVMQSFKAIRADYKNIELEPLDNCDQFFLPPEL